MTKKERAAARARCAEHRPLYTADTFRSDLMEALDDNDRLQMLLEANVAMLRMAESCIRELRTEIKRLEINAEVEQGERDLMTE